MWAENNFQQLSFDDILLNMPKYLKNFLKDSWADVFQEIIFPAIDEKRFSVLYSDKPSRPNSPVNVIIGSLILKEIFQLSDKELLGAIYFDDRFQYALRLTSEEKPPISINTFSNFRRRVYEFEQETNRDLIKEEVKSISNLIAKKLKIDNKKVRVDSFMFASSCRNLSRLELIYTVNRQMAKKLKQEDEDIIPHGFHQYLKDGHKKNTIYTTHDNEAESKLEFLLKHSKTFYDLILESSLDIYKSQEFKNLKRLLNKQTKSNDKDDDDNNYTPKENGEIKPDSL
ncbi:MAG TPA: transposase [Halanaerobiales bacterium]|nr:transposase [Halanaerobiales bacterium]